MGFTTIGGPRILVVDDDVQLADTLVEYLTKLGYQAEAAYSGKEGLNKFEQNDFQMVITDMVMPDINGIELMEAIKKLDDRTTVLVITGFGSIESAVSAIKKGAYDFIPKPFKMEELEVILERALERYTIFRKLSVFRRMFYSLLTIVIIILVLILMFIV